MEQVSASIGLLKQSLSVLGYEIAVSIAGPKTSLCLSPAGSEFKTGFKRLQATDLVKAINTKLQGVNKTEEFVNKTVKSGTHANESAVLLRLSCGPHVISLTPAGIIISSNIAITFDGSVNVSGDLVVTGNTTLKSCDVVQGIDVGGCVSATSVWGVTLQSQTSTQGLGMEPVLIPQAVVAIAKSEALKLLKKTADTSGVLINSGAEKLNEASQIAMSAAEEAFV